MIRHSHAAESSFAAGFFMSKITSQIFRKLSNLHSTSLDSKLSHSRLFWCLACLCQKSRDFHRQLMLFLFNELNRNFSQTLRDVFFVMLLSEKSTQLLKIWFFIGSLTLRENTNNSVFFLCTEMKDWEKVALSLLPLRICQIHQSVPRHIMPMFTKLFWWTLAYNHSKMRCTGKWRLQMKIL